MYSKASFLFSAGTAILRQTAALKLGTEAKDPCDCLNWAEVYYKGGAKCGDTHELNPAFPYYKKHWPEATAGEVRFLALTEWHDVYCDNFFMKLDNNMCVNGDHGYGTGLKDWCYVKADCKELNGGSNATQWVNWKNCEAGRDQFMRALSFEEVIMRAIAKNFTLPVILPNVYKSAADGTYMTDFSVLLQAGGMNPASMPKMVPVEPLSNLTQQELAKAQASGQPTFFWRAVDHEDPNYLVKGLTVYEVFANEAKCIAGPGCTVTVY